MSALDQLTKQIANTIRESNKTKTSPYDTSAEVIRIDGNTAWVHIPGGVNETPVQKTVNAVKGDIVQIRIGGGRGWIVGNSTSPPTDDSKANYAYNYASQVDNRAGEAINLANEAIKIANEAKEQTASGDKTFVFEQATPSNEWTAVHNLNKYPSITVIDSAGTVVEGDYEYIDVNTVKLYFSGEFAGKAFFN